MTVNIYSYLRLAIRFNQYLGVLSQHKLAFIFDPVGITVSRCGTRNICFISFLIGIIITLLYVVVAFTPLDTDKELTILFIGTIHISDIATTKDVTVLTFQLLRCTYRTTMYIYLCLSEDVTIGVECTALTQVVISSTATKNVAVNIAFKECHISLTSLVDTLQSTNAIVNACCFNDATSYSGNLTTAKECVTNMTTIHL